MPDFLCYAAFLENIIAPSSVRQDIENTLKHYRLHMKSSTKRLLLLTVTLDENKWLRYMAHFTLLKVTVTCIWCRRHSYAINLSLTSFFPLLRPLLERVWHPLSLILYEETMDSGGRSYYVSKSKGGGDRESKSRMKTGGERWERGRAG